MRSKKVIFTSAIILAFFVSPAVYASKDRGKLIYEGAERDCYEQDVKDDEAYINKAEATEKAGKLKEAFAAADKGPPYGCWDQSEERRAGIIERTYKKLGQDEEKAGHLYEAHKYFIYPFDNYIAPNYYRERFEKNYSLDDAHRTMLAYAKANPDDYKVVEEAVRYFNRWHEDMPPQTKEALVLAERGGAMVLEKEEKAFTAHKYEQAFNYLEESEKWYALTNDSRKVYARGKQRVDSLLAESSYDAIARALDYTNVTLLGSAYTRSYDAARARASKLGDEAEHKGDLKLAERFYSLAGDDAKHDAVVEKMTTMDEQKEKQQDQAEAKRKKKFEEEQKSLEDELGF